MADISALTGALGTELGSSINNLANIDPTKGVSEQLYLQQSKNILDAQKNMALEEVYSKGQAADYQKAQSDAYLAKQKKEYEDTSEKTKKLEEQQNWEYPEFHPTQTNLQDMATIFSLVGIVGTMLGGGGRNAGMNALSGITGMMEGWKKGEKEKFNQEKITFDENIKVMEQKNNALQKRIEQVTKDSVRNREAAKDEYAVLLAENPYLKKVDAVAGLKGVIAAANEANKSMLSLLEFKEKQRERAEARREKAAEKTGSTALNDYFPGLKFQGGLAEQKDKRDSINTGALSLATAEDLKKYASEHRDQLGRKGQVAQNVERYFDSIKTGKGLENEDDKGQPALVFAKRYAAYLVGYERALAGSGRAGSTVAFQKRFNELMSQNQFNSTGFEQLMNEQMNEVARTTASKDPAITGQGLLNYGKDIYSRGAIYPETSQAPTTPKKEKPSNAPDNAKLAEDGHYYSPDPNRPGKYLKWD